MHDSQSLASRDFAICRGAMRRLYGEGTGSVIVEGQSDPFQGVPRIWTLLSSGIPCLWENHSATTGAYIVFIKNQIDLPNVASELVSEFEAVSPCVSISPASVLDRVRSVFGLNISETAEVFGVTRQTVYQWMKLADLEQVRAHENRDRLKQIYGAAQTWESLPTLKGRWLHALLPTGNTVLDLLKAPLIDFDALQAAYKALAGDAAKRRLEEGDRATQAVTALAGAFTGLGAGRKARRG